VAVHSADRLGARGVSECRREDHRKRERERERERES
jgi:hypothetical protein